MKTLETKTAKDKLFDGVVDMSDIDNNSETTQQVYSCDPCDGCSSSCGGCSSYMPDSSDSPRPYI